MGKPDFSALLKKEMASALGCTGPTAYALAGASCKPWLTAPVKEMRVYVNPGFLKIGFGVATPGTSKPGIEIPAALGLINGDWTRGLSVLDRCNKTDMEQAIALAESGRVKVLCEEGERGIYIRCEVDTENESVVSVVKGRHDGIVLIKVGNETKFFKELQAAEEADMPEPFTLEEVFDYLDSVDPEEISFLLDGYHMNVELALDGLRQGFGLASGQAFLRESMNRKSIPSDLFDDPIKYLPVDVKMRSKILVAAASDARMGGSYLPAMAAMGDGNQGLTAMIPVGITAEQMNKSREETIRALALSCLMLFYVKMNIGRESAFCLCSIAASAGATAGIGYLRGMEQSAIQIAVKNVIAPLCGMLCDGAKNACALKMAISTETAFSGVDLAQEGVECGFYDGVADDTLQQTIECIAALADDAHDLLDNSMVRQIIRKTERKNKAPTCRE